VLWADEPEVRSTKRKRIEEPEVAEPMLDQGIRHLALPDVLPHDNILHSIHTTVTSEKNKVFLLPF
jgi:hypothetical protein